MKILLSFLFFLISFLFGIYFGKSLLKNNNIQEERVKILKNDDYESKIFELEDELKSIKNLCSNKKDLYNLMLGNYDFCLKVGTKTDLSHEISFLFDYLGRIKYFHEIEQKYKIIYDNSYRMPLKSDLISSIYYNEKSRIGFLNDLFVFINKRDEKNKKISNILQLLNGFNGEFHLDIDPNQLNLDSDALMQLNLLLKSYQLCLDIRKKYGDVLNFLN